MDEDPLKNSSQNIVFNKEINPRSLLECLDVQSTFQKRKKTKTFERSNSSKEFLLFNYNKKIVYFSTW
jgi:IS1 family transposase